jgi:hypothetical protein
MVDSGAIALVQLNQEQQHQYSWTKKQLSAGKDSILHTPTQHQPLQVMSGMPRKRSRVTAAQLSN